MGNIRQEDAAFELQPWLPFCGYRQLLFAADVFRFLSVKIDVFATEQDSLEQVDVVLLSVSSCPRPSLGGRMNIN